MPNFERLFFSSDNLSKRVILIPSQAIGSVLCLVFGLENCVDFCSSVVVLWRFFAPRKMTKDHERTLKRRELRASMLISFILVLLGLAVIATSSYDIAMGQVKEAEIDAVIYIAMTSFFICGILTIFKFHYSNKLNSESLYKDGVCSLIGTILAAALFVNTLIIKSRPEIWFLDPFVAMICGFAALYIGIHSIFISFWYKRVPLFSLSWWVMSRGQDNGHGSDGSSTAANSNNNDASNDNSTKEPTMSPIDKPSDLEMKERSSRLASSATNLSGEVV